MRSEARERLLTQRPACHLHLHEAAASSRQCLFEKFQRVIIIEHLHGISQSNELFIGHLLEFFPLAFLRGTILVQVGQERFVLGQALFGVLKIIFLLRNGHTKLTNEHTLGLDCLGQCSDLFFLRCDQSFEICDGTFLSGGDVCKLSLHFVFDGLQDASNLSALRDIPSLIVHGEERCKKITVRRADIDIGFRDASQGGCTRCLQESTGHTRLNCWDRLAECCDVRLQVSGLTVKLLSL
mmetsp:Transcript_114844/g.203477  ORF Transcript_114844/g.203477 Transcript_114844/m.203477 type:complete len:239 (+) Transcript_114844:433-1149(+)